MPVGHHVRALCERPDAGIAPALDDRFLFLGEEALFLQFQQHLRLCTGTHPFTALLLQDAGFLKAFLQHVQAHLQAHPRIADECQGGAVVVDDLHLRGSLSPSAVSAGHPPVQNPSPEPQHATYHTVRSLPR